MRSSASPISSHSTTQTSPASYPAARSSSSWSTPPPTSPPRHQASSRHATPSGAHPSITGSPRLPAQHERREPSSRAGSAAPASPLHNASSRHATPCGTRPSIASPPRLPTQHTWHEPSLRADSTPPSSPSQHAGSRHATPSRTHPSVPIPSYPPLRDEQRHPSLNPGSWATPPTGPPQQASSRHATHGSPSAYPSLPSHMPSRDEWRQISSQPGYPPPLHEATRLDAPAYEPYGQEQQKARKPAKTSKLGGIPKDQLQRFRVVDLGSAPSSSGMKRTRSPDDESQPGAKFMATSSDAAGAKKGKGKVKLSLAEEVKQADKRRSKEANRQQSYRNEIDSAFDELLMAMYGDEEKAKFARAAHGKKGCIRKAIEMIRNGVQERCTFQEKVQDLKGRDEEVTRMSNELAEYREQVAQLREKLAQLQKHQLADKD